MFLDFSVATHDRVTIKKIGYRQPFVKTERTGVVCVFFEDGRTRTAQTIEMPLAEMSRRVAGVFHRLAKRLFLQA